MPRPTHPEGSLAVLALCLLLAVPAEARYDRGEWAHWLDSDRDCQDTRTEVLIAEAVRPPVLDAKRCRVLRGLWIDPYSGQHIYSPHELDVDHMVPLGFAATHGGQAWSVARKAAYANDLTHADALVAVALRLNRQKGDHGPDAWRPPLRAAWCWYGRAWASTVAVWDLRLSLAEWAAIGTLLVTCTD